MNKVGPQEPKSCAKIVPSKIAKRLGANPGPLFYAIREVVASEP